MRFVRTTESVSMRSWSGRARSNRVWVFLAILAALAVVGTWAVAATPRDTLVVGTTDRISQLSPANSYDYWTWHVLEQTAQNLVTIKPGTSEIVPCLAKSWTVSPDARVYTFQLQKGVTFTDGTPFNAAAMKWSLERALKLDGPEGAVGLIKNIAKIETAGAYTLRITLKEPDATFLARLADPVAPAMAMSPKSTPADRFANGKYAGTGPYRLVSYVPEERVVLEAYSRFWGPKPKIKRVVEVFYADAAALRAAIQSGQVDVAFRTFNPEDILSLKKDPNLQVIQGATSLSVRYLVFNVTQKPFDDQRVRQAIAYAVDRDQLVKDVFSGLNHPIYSMVPPGLWSHIDAFPKRDLAKARAILAAAGYTSAHPLTITLWYTPLHYGTTEADVAAVLKRSLEATGVIKVDLQSLEWGTYVQRQSDGALGMFLLGWYPDFLDPDNFLAPWLVEAPGPLGTHLDKAVSAADKAAYEKFTTLLQEAKRVADKSQRTAKYEEAQKLLAQTAILVPLWQNNHQHVAVARKGVQGIILDPSMNFREWLISK